MERFNYTFNGNNINIVILDEETRKNTFEFTNGNGLALVNEIVSSNPLFKEEQVICRCLEYNLFPNGGIVQPIKDVSYTVEPDEYRTLALIPLNEIQQIKNLINGRLFRKLNHVVFADDNLRFLLPIEYTLSLDNNIVTVNVSQATDNERLEYSFDGGQNYQESNISIPLSVGQHNILVRYTGLFGSRQEKNILVE